jgi:hypothetical protein
VLCTMSAMLVAVLLLMMDDGMIGDRMVFY